MSNEATNRETLPTHKDRTDCDCYVCKHDYIRKEIERLQTREQEEQGKQAFAKFMYETSLKEYNELIKSNQENKES